MIYQYAYVTSRVRPSYLYTLHLGGECQGAVVSDTYIDLALSESCQSTESYT